jgi:hypothetical protein
MTSSQDPARTSREERAARAATGMPVHHPELITSKPSRAEWQQLATWCAEMWPHDEYTAIVADGWNQDHKRRYPQGGR